MIKKKILLIAYNFPPLISPQSLRWFYLVRELSSLGYDIDVLTVKMPERFKDLLESLPDKIAVHRSFPGPFYYLTFKFSIESSNIMRTESPDKTNSIWRVFSGIHFKFYRALYYFLFPDIYAEWFPFAILEGSRLIRKNRYDVVISSSEPRVCHLIGYFLKRLTGIPWIADYGDPWIYPIPTLRESGFKKRLLEKSESIILKRVDMISVAAEGIKRLYVERYPFIDIEKIRIIPQGFDPDIFSGIEGEKSDKFRIAYCGSFYRGLRDPMAFFEAIENIGIDDIEVVIAGRINEFADILRKRFNKGIIQYRGFIGHKESMSLQKGATVLLHIGNATDVQVPGKIYEYFGAKRPILCIRGGNIDTADDLIERYNKGITVANNKEDISIGIMKLYELWQKNMLNNSFDLESVDEFTWRKRAEEMSRIIEEL